MSGGSDGPDARRSERTGLQPPGLREQVLGAGADNQVVQDTDLDEPKRFGEPFGDELVGLAGLGSAAPDGRL